jgi:molybdenum cofactor cytidylyltransferase
MLERPGLYGVILAAGDSTRMGRDKALLPWPPAKQGNATSVGPTFLSAAIRALSPFTESVVVVAGKNAGNIAAVVDANGASLVQNPAPERGQFSSLQVGLKEVLARGGNAAMITLVDRPPLSASTLQQLCTSFELALSLGRWGVAPENDGEHGHPLLASLKLMEAFLRASPASNAREIKRAHAQYIEYVPVTDPFVSANVNTPEEYAALSAPASPQPK